MDTIRTVELFAGVGGFRLGLESASDRFKVIWANQWEPSMREQYAFECYTTHFGNKKYHVSKISPKLKSMYLTMICLLEDSRVRTILS